MLVLGTAVVSYLHLFSAFVGDVTTRELSFRTLTAVLPFGSWGALRWGRAIRAVWLGLRQYRWPGLQLDAVPAFGRHRLHMGER